MCCCSSHGWDQRAWTGLGWVNREAGGGVRESVKDGRLASFLKTLPPQSSPFSVHCGYYGYYGQESEVFDLMVTA